MLCLWCWPKGKKSQHLHGYETGRQLHNSATFFLLIAHVAGIVYSRSTSAFVSQVATNRTRSLSTLAEEAVLRPMKRNAKSSGTGKRCFLGRSILWPKLQWLVRCYVVETRQPGCKSRLFALEDIHLHGSCLLFRLVVGDELVTFLLTDAAATSTQACPRASRYEVLQNLQN